MQMKAIAMLMIVFTMQVSATGYSQNVTLRQRNASLEKIFREIHRQTGYLFLYGNSVLQKTGKISIDVTNTPLEKALDHCLVDQPLTYSIVDKTIVVKLKAATPVTLPPDVPKADTTQPSLTGKVTDEAGTPLPGATILLQGTTRGVATDAEGRFLLKEVPPDATVVISFTGFETQRIALNGRYNVNVYMKLGASSLNETIVVGYGTQKRENLTGAVTQVSGEVLANRPVTDIGKALQGVVPNLNISTTGDPGGPGTPSGFNIRGTTNLSGVAPLYVIDGVTGGDINTLNPADVESVTVLKDAAAGAIYGARSAYGVILITTKRGKKGEKAHVSYSGMAAWNTPTRLPKMANSLAFAETYNDAATNSGVAAPFSDAAIERIKKYMADPNSIPITIPNPNDPNKWDWDNANGNTNWVKEYVKPWAFTQKHDLSVSGGSGNNTYYMSFGYYEEGGNLRYGNDKFDRYNVAANLHSEPASWMRTELRIKYSKGKRDYPFPYSDLQGNWFHLLATRWPTWPAVNPDGHLSQVSVLPYFIDGGRSISDNNELWLTGAVEIEPVKHWKINMDYTWNNSSSRQSDHDAFVYAYALDGTRYGIGHAQNAISKNSGTNEYKSFNVYSSYERNLKKHYFKLLAGQQLEVGKYFYLFGSRTGLITDAIPALNIGTGEQRSSDGASHYAISGTFARFNYNYDEKYLVEFNARYDGTSRFPPGKRFGFFPSVSAGYNIARENFWPLQEQVNEFKIRASYGSIGNQVVSDNYLYLSRMPVNTKIGYLLNNIRPNAFGTPGLVSADLTWETSRTFDVGLDVGMLNNRLRVVYDWYVRNTLNMMGPAEALPATLGASVPQKNNADLQTKGFELSINWRDQIGKDISYNAWFGLSNYKAVVKRYFNPNKILSTYYEGQTINEIWGYHTDGLIQTQEQLDNMPDQSLFYGQWNKGDVLYRDMNGDKKITYGNNTVDNPGDMQVIGNSRPQFSFGWGGGINWKGLDLSMIWQGVAKRDLALNGTIFYGLLGGYGSAVWENTLDYWTPENTGAYWPRPYFTGEINKNRHVQKSYLQNGAYMRLKNLQIGYTIPQQWLSRLKMQQIRVFVSGENLITFSHLNDNFDPEVVSGSWGPGKIYPLMKMFSFGVNVGF